MKRKLSVFFMIIGIICIVAALSLLVYNNIENDNAKKSSEEIIKVLHQEVEKNKSDPLPTDPFDDEMKVTVVEDNGFIGYLTVPSIGLELPVMAEFNYDRLKKAPCRYYGSVKTDNLVIAAHDYRSHFGYIGNLNPEDKVLFTDMEGNVYRYWVTGVDVILATDVDKVKDTGDDLILYTCDYGGTKRITVRCSYVE